MKAKDQPHLHAVQPVSKERKETPALKEALGYLALTVLMVSASTLAMVLLLTESLFQRTRSPATRTSTSRRTIPTRRPESQRGPW